MKAFDAGFSAIVEGRKKFLVDFGEEKDPVANQDCIDDLRLALQIMVRAWKPLDDALQMMVMVWMTH